MSGERVVVVGAGPAGIRAAEVLASPGVAVTLVDEQATPGGRHYRRPADATEADYRRFYGYQAGRARRLQATAAELAGRIDYRSGTRAVGLIGKSLQTEKNGVAETLPFEALILAPGATDLVLPFPGAVGPGVVTLDEADAALLRGDGAVGRRTIFLGSGPQLYAAADRHIRAGAEVAAVLETADPALARGQLLGLLSGGFDFARQLLLLARLKATKVSMLAGVRPLAVIHDRGAVGLRCRDRRGTEFQVAGDAVALGFGRMPDCRLAEQAGCALTYDAGARQWLPATDADGLTSLPGVYVAGDGRQAASADAAEASGALAAFAVLIELGYPVTVGMHRFWQTRAGYGSLYRRALQAAFPSPLELAVEAEEDTVVCACLGVTAGTLRQAARGRSPAAVAQAKADLGIGAGHCGGLYCVPAADEILAAELGIAREAVRRQSPAVVPP